MKLKVYEIFNISEVLDKLIAQQLEYNVNIAYKIYQISLKLNEAQSYVLSRLHMVLGDDANLTELNPQQKILYDAVIQSEVDIEDLPELTMGDVVDSVNAKLSVSDIATRQTILKKVEND